jgi:hypothetical protein
MIEENELRIGNYIKRKQSGTIVETKQFMLHDYELKYFEPIPLTEEWLLKFGFEKQMAWTFAIELTSNLKFVYYLGQKGWSINNKNYPDFTNLKHVNSLQNLYFALTGKELTIKPNE